MSEVRTTESYEPSPHDHQPICLYFPRGLCEYGDNCDFAHVESSENDAPPVCRYFLKGRCRYGDGCIFLHPKQEKRISHFIPQSWRPEKVENKLKKEGEGGEGEEEGREEWKKVKPKNQSKKKVQICKNCGAFYTLECAFCSGDIEN